MGIQGCWGDGEWRMVLLCDGCFYVWADLDLNESVDYVDSVIRLISVIQELLRGILSILNLSLQPYNTDRGSAVR